MLIPHQSCNQHLILNQPFYQKYGDDDNDNYNEN